MEEKSGTTRNIFKYIAYICLALGAFVIVKHFTKPVEMDAGAKKDMALFIQNSILDIDRKLKNVGVHDDVASFVSWNKSNTALYNDAKDNKDKQIKEQSQILKERMVKIQTREFPEMRDEYVNLKKDVLSQEKIQIAASGKNKEVLTFTGGVFEPKRTKRKFLKDIKQVAKDLRFKEVIFKWSDKGEDYTSYQIDSKTDSEI